MHFPAHLDPLYSPPNLPIRTLEALESHQDHSASALDYREGVDRNRVVMGNRHFTDITL